MRGEARALSVWAGGVVVLKRELRALLGDKQSLYLTVMFGLVFPWIISRNNARGAGSALAVMTQVTLFPFFAAFQAAITSFVGEREHGTFGPLLATPLHNTSIFAGKLLGVYIPGMITSATGLVVVLATLPPGSRAVLASLPARFLVEAVGLSFIAGFVMVVAGVVIGARAKTLRGAQMLAGVVFAPLLFGVFFLAAEIASHETIGLLSLLGLLALGIAGVGVAGRMWRREEALAST